MPKLNVWTSFLQQIAHEQQKMCLMCKIPLTELQSEFPEGFIILFFMYIRHHISTAPYDISILF
jgi:hypothetical protein